MNELIADQRRRRIVGPLANTIEKPGQGVATIGADGKPQCSRHGAMNRVSAERDWWRCLACNIGVECEIEMNAADQRCEMCDAPITWFWVASRWVHNDLNQRDHDAKPAIVEPAVNPIAASPRASVFDLAAAIADAASDEISKETLVIMGMQAALTWNGQSHEANPIAEDEAAEWVNKGSALGYGVHERGYTAWEHVETGHVIAVPHGLAATIKAEAAAVSAAKAEALIEAATALLAQDGLAHDLDCPSRPATADYDPSRCNGCVHARAHAAIEQLGRSA